MEVDKNYRAVIRKTNKQPNVIMVSEIPGILAQFVHDNKELDQVQKQLEEYLETKRTAFPRFYFLSNDEYDFHLNFLHIIIWWFFKT